LIATATFVALQIFALGANAVQPFRLARGTERERGLWSLLVLPLLLAALLVALLHLRAASDAALAAGLSWPPQARVARLLLVGLFAGAGGAVLTAIGGRKFEPAAWRVAGGLAVVLAAAAALAGELLRIGGGPAGGLGPILLGAAGRLALTLAAGESALGRPRWLALAAAVVLPLSYLAMPEVVRQPLRPDLLTLGAAALLLAAAPVLPRPFARPAAAVGVALAAIYLAQMAHVSEMLEIRGYGPGDAFVSPP
jgi:hypothetical protein